MYVFLGSRLVPGLPHTHVCNPIQLEVKVVLTEILNTSFVLMNHLIMYFSMKLQVYRHFVAYAIHIFINCTTESSQKIYHFRWLMDTEEQMYLLILFF